jgi:hypothetical protein
MPCKTATDRQYKKGSGFTAKRYTFTYTKNLLKKESGT